VVVEWRDLEHTTKSRITKEQSDGGTRGPPI
jgi:hypothetical protein